MRKLQDVLFVGIALTALLAGCLGTVIKYTRIHGAASFYENRTLADLPVLSGAESWTGVDMTEAETFVSDYFPARNSLLRMNTRLDMMLHRPVINNLVVKNEVILPFHKYNHWSLDYLKNDTASMATTMAAIDSAVRAQGGTFIYLGLPEHSSYFQDRYPDYMDNRAWQMDEQTVQFAAAMAAQGVSFLDGREYFHSLGDPEEFYSLSDHHYACEGMLAAYRYLMEEINAKTGLGLRILTEEDLKLTRLPNPFLGSYNRQIFGCWTGREWLTAVELRDPIPFRRWDNGVEVPAALCAFPATDDKQVSYSLYMGGDVGETILQTERPELPKLLVWGDSFTNAMETILWASFDEMRSLDYRYYNSKDLTDYIADYQPDVVVCIRDDTAYLDTRGNGAVK